MLGTISFTYPWVLATWPLAAVGLALAYFRRRDEIVTLPSVLLLQQLPQSNPKNRRFSLPLIALLELLLLSILILGSAGIAVDNTILSRVIIIDNSPSMSLKTLNNLTLLEISLEKAKEICGSLSQVEIYVTNPNLRSLTHGLVPTEIACPLLSEIAIEYGDDNLNSAITNVLQTSTLPLTIVSDHRVKTTRNDQFQDRLISIPISSQLEPNNIAILDVGDDEKGVRTTIASFSARDGKVELIVESVDSSLVLVKQYSQVLSLTAGERREILIPHSSLPPSFALKVSLIAPQYQGIDLIEIDNSAWLRRSNSKVAKLALVSPTPIRLGDLPGSEIKQLRPEEFQDIMVDNDNAFDGLIFYRTIPMSLPNKPTLLISPPSSPLLPSRPCSATATPSRWHQDHPLTRYVTFPKLQFANPLCLGKANWGETLLAIPNGDIALFGEHNGIPLVALGFDIFPFDGRKNLSLSVFTLNVMQWLFGRMLDQGWVPLTEPMLIDDSDKYSRPLLKSAEISSRPPGLYSIHKNDRITGQNEKIVAANFFSEDESNGLESTELVVDLPTSQPKTSPSERDYCWLITQIALTLILVEWLLLALKGIRSLNPLAISRLPVIRKANGGER